ncbi:MAG: hypothetical protein ACHP93_02410 [Solirubrobacterales bacterium]
MRVHAGVRLTLALAASIALAVCSSGCGSSSAVLDPVAQAADATSLVGGAHMAFEVQVSAAALPAPFTVSGEGFFNYKTREGSLSLDMTGLPSTTATSLPSGSLQMEELFTSSAIYVGSPLFAGKLPGGAQWMKIDVSKFGQALGFNLQQLAGGQSNPAQFLEYLKASGGTVTPVGHELVRGVATTHYRGAIDLNKVADVLPSSNRDQLRAALAKLITQTGSASIPVDVWVDAHRLVRRITMALAVSTGAQQAQTRMTIDLFGFGSTPPVTPPPQAEVYDATQAALSGLSSAGGG